jgi:hypothetical protein
MRTVRAPRATVTFTSMHAMMPPLPGRVYFDALDPLAVKV